jgi:hypothetical protein
MKSASISSHRRRLTATGWLAALALGLCSLPALAQAPSKALANPTLPPDAGARTVRVVCIADSAATLADSRYRLLHRISGLFQIFGDNASASDIEKLIKAKYPPVGRWHFLPAGTGYVVHHQDNHSYVVTNWHVAVGCSASERERVQLGVIEGTGNEIQPILADHVAINSANVPQRVQALCRSTTGNQRCGLRLPNAKGIPGTPSHSKEAQENDANVLLYAPDVAVLKLRERSRVAPVVFAPSAAAESLRGRALQIVGYPQVAMELQQSELGTRRALAAEVTTPATFSRIEPLKREQVGAGPESSIRLDLLQLAAQVHPGNSGGPLLDEGRVVGMVTATVAMGERTRRADADATDAEAASRSDPVLPAGYALAVKAADVMQVLRELGVPFMQAETAAPAPAPAPASRTLLDDKPIAKTEPESTGMGRQQWLLIGGLALLVVVLGVATSVHLANKSATPGPTLGPAPRPDWDRDPVGPTVLNPSLAPAPAPAPAPSAPTNAALVLRADTGPATGRYPLPAPNGGLSLYIGRDPKSCQLVLPNHLDMVSSVHCCVSWTPQNRVAAIRDMSRNGTWVNGQRMSADSGSMTLRHGDTVDLGAPGLNRFVVELL